MGWINFFMLITRDQNYYAYLKQSLITIVVSAKRLVAGFHRAFACNRMMLCSEGASDVNLKQAQPFSEAFLQLEKVPAILHEIQSHSEHYNLPTRLIKMGRGGKRVRDW